MPLDELGVHLSGAVLPATWSTVYHHRRNLPILLLLLTNVFVELLRGPISLVGDSDGN